MSRFLRFARGPAALAAPLVGLLVGGCASTTHADLIEAQHTFQREAVPAAPPAGRGAGGARDDDDACDDGGCVAGDDGALDRAALVRAVAARNPTLQAARAAWRAALAEVPQDTAFEDPMLSYSFAPLSVPGIVGVGPVPFGHNVKLSQKLPIPGRLDAEGGVALADVEVARQGYREAAQALAETAGQLYAALYGNARALETNTEFTALFAALRKSAAGSFEAGRAGLADPLRFDVALAHSERERVILTHQHDDVVARINALLHRPPNAPLPPPPKALAVPAIVDEAPQKLFDDAAKARPELQAARARIERAEAERRRAKLAYIPDVTVSGNYDSMWPMPQHQWMLGASVALPLQIPRRDAAVDEADARRANAESEEAALLDRVRTEIETAHNDAQEAVQVVRVYEERLLPSARAEIEAAQAAVEVGAAPGSWRDLVDAETELLRLTLDEKLEWAELFRRVAALERAAGVSLPHPPKDTAAAAGAHHAR